MAVQTSQWHQVKTAIRTALAARAGLVGVQVYSAFVPMGDAQDSIQLAGNDDLSPPLAQLGARSREETMTLRGFCRSFRPGSDEEVIQEARAAVTALWAEVEAYFVEITTAPSLGGIVKTAELMRASTLEMPWETSSPGRLAQIEFDIKTFNRRTS